ncbi:hypothetical protein CEXT_183491 [Caerostris extrusa]|uniref:Uncharacterized protein n=1 Tax=Caerostris extrusa TaxID=172846 RepID=A0AAV4MQ35_CAEEX|nr:hypothetical protein CEXT_183491 [Caerostris extrusa]
MFEDNGPNVDGEQAGDVLQELSQNDLHGLVPETEDEDILRQISDPSFELDSLFLPLFRMERPPRQPKRKKMTPSFSQSSNSNNSWKRNLANNTKSTHCPPPPLSACQIRRVSSKMVLVT